MGDLKSAWEIAQEKAKKLGQLSAEELQQHREERCRQVGTAIAQRYLDNWDALSLTSELHKHPEEEGGVVKRAILNHLIQALDLRFFMEPVLSDMRFFAALRMTGNEGFRMTDKLEKIARGIASLEPKSAPITEQISQLSWEYEGAIRKTKQEMERRGKETLHQLRISGTAVGDINIEATPQWQQSWHKLIEPFQPRLDTLKQELINNVVGLGLAPDYLQ